MHLGTIHYEAEEGAHDDLAMTLVIFAWLVQQRYFKDITDLDLRQKMYEDFEEQFEQDMLPFGIIDDGREEDTYTDNTGQTLGSITFSREIIFKHLFQSQNLRQVLLYRVLYLEVIF